MSQAIPISVSFDTQRNGGGNSRQKSTNPRRSSSVYHSTTPREEKNMGKHDGPCATTAEMTGYILRELEEGAVTVGLSIDPSGLSEKMFSCGKCVDIYWEVRDSLPHGTVFCNAKERAQAPEIRAANAAAIEKLKSIIQEGK